MNRILRAVIVVSLLLAVGYGASAQAETVVEAWRGGGFHQPQSVSANSTDNSCWVADTGNSQVVHLRQESNVMLAKEQAVKK